MWVFISHPIPFIQEGNTIMAKNDIYEVIKYIKDEISAYNKLEAIVSKEDRTDTEGMIKAIKNASGIMNDEVDQICRVLNYYKHLTGGITFEYGLIFQNGDIWNVEYTASLRSDRVEGLTNRVTKCPAETYYIVVGDLEKGDKSKKRLYKKNLHNICIVSLEEFIDDIMYKIYSYDKNGERRWRLSESPLSKINGLRGPMWEKCIAHSLSTRGVFLPNHYSQIMNKIGEDEGFVEADVLSVVAKAVGTKREKTDINVKIKLRSGVSVEKNISMKSSSHDKVSLHQAKYSDFVRELHIHPGSDEDTALLTFAKDGSMKNMTVKQKDDLTRFFALPVNYDLLIKWAFQGVSGAVDYVLLHSYEQDELRCRRNTKIYDIIEYMNKVKTKGTSGGFGTGLEWTYNKKDIQLKVPFVF